MTSCFNKEEGKVLLVLLPVWDPLIPPLGIASLKTFLQGHGYEVKTVDANVDDGLRDIYRKYFGTICEFVPEEKRRHLYNTGHEVLKNHMMAHLNARDEGTYMELVKILLHKTFICHLDDSQVSRLDRVIETFYTLLESYFIDLLEKEKPTLLGLSVYGGTLAASLFAFKLTKERYPHIKTVMGGGIFSGELAVDSADFQFFLEKTPFIDKIIAGEGENLFLKYLRGELPESQRVYTLKDIDGEVADISRLGIADFSDFNLSPYVQMAAYTSRSCPFQCSFCVEATYWGKYRKKKAGQIADELEELNRRHGSRLFLMCDSLLNPVMTDLANEFIKRDTSLYWGGYLRAGNQVCDPQNTLLWRRGGFYRARLGLESGSPRILEAMGKGINIEQIKLSVSGLAYAGIKTTTYWVIGYPGETEEDFQMTLSLIEELKDDIYEADCNAFWYFLHGQVSSETLAEAYKPVLLYPADAREMLILQTRVLDCEPSREVTIDRVNRFVGHCNRLKIPNLYSLHDTYVADLRWEKLHRNAVPSLVSLNSGACREEVKNVRSMILADRTVPYEGDWNF
jgi:hypothetical protein